MSDTVSGNSNNEARRKLVGCLGGLGILLAVFGVLYYVTQIPSQRVAEIVEMIEDLRHERPDSISEENWESVIELTKSLHDKCNIFYEMKTPEVLKFKQQMKDRIRLRKVNPQTIYKIWDMYAEISRQGRRYVAIWLPELKSKLGVEPADGEVAADDVEAPILGDDEADDPGKSSEEPEEN